MYEFFILVFFFLIANVIGIWDIYLVYHVTWHMDMVFFFLKYMGLFSYLMVIFSNFMDFSFPPLKVEEVSCSIPPCANFGGPSPYKIML